MRAFFGDAGRDFRAVWRKRYVYLLLLPTFSLLLLFSYYPVISALVHSFTKWEGLGQAEFVGLDNYRRILRDEVLGMSTWNIVRLMVFRIVITVTVPLLVAELIFHLKGKRAQYIYRVLFIVPMVVPGIVGVLIWRFIYDAQFGLLNNLFRAVGLGSLAQAWLGDPNVALYSIMFMGFPWVGGIGMLIYYAGLQAIPVSVHEAAMIDGAGVLRKFFTIDLPLLGGQIKLLVVLTVIGGLQGFQNILILTEGGPGFSTTVPGLEMYRNAFAFDRWGYACSIGVVLFLVILTLTYINMKYLKSSVEYGTD